MRSHLASSPLLSEVESAFSPTAVGRSTLTEGLVRRKGGGAVAEEADGLVTRAQGGAGAALPEALRTKFEASLGTDLGSVRVHTDAPSADAAAGVGARAYAFGQDIHFADGEYQPGTADGERLLAHEVAHTVQQAGPLGVRRQDKPAVTEPGDALELEADRAADAMVAGAATSLRGGASAVVARAPPSAPASEGSTSGPSAERDKWQDFLNKCAAANSYLDSCYPAAHAFMNKCTVNYKLAFEKHEGAFLMQAASEKLTRDMLWGVLFAGIGGGLGGAVGGGLSLLAKQKAGKALEAMAGAITAGAVTDAAKDLAKYVARMPPKVLAGGKGGSDANVSDTPPDAATGRAPSAAAPGGSNVDPKAPTAPGGAAGGGAVSVTGLDPFTWHLEVEALLDTEESDAFAALHQMQTHAQSAIDMGAIFNIDYDPEARVRETCRANGIPLVELKTTPVPTVEEYERAFWEVWLANYSYTVDSTLYCHNDDLEGSFEAKPAIGKNIRAEIDRLAKTFGETGEAWIAKYGAPAKQAAEAEAKQRNEENPIEHHGDES